MRKKDAKKFWKKFVLPIIPRITAGKTWYDFSLASLQTFEEMKFLKVCQEEQYIEKGAFRFTVDLNGTCKSLSINGEVYTYLPGMQREIFAVYLPKN